MSEPAVFALIRDGETRFFADRWASALLRREVLWGPSDFEAWVEQFEPLDEWSDDCSGGAVVDFDKRVMLWTSNNSGYEVPRLWQIYSRLLAAAWPKFEVKTVTGGIDELTRYLGIEPSQNYDDEEDDVDEEEDDEDYEVRALTLAKAGFNSDDDDDDDDDDDEPHPCAWITLIDTDGTARQRQLRELSLDLLKGSPEALHAVTELPPAEIPKEESAAEGLLLNPAERTARIWGSTDLLDKMKQHGKLWKGWQLKWTHRGYAEQCAASNTKGMPMSDVDALARILPLIISTKQFNLGTFVEAIGGGVKKFAKKATGCLIVLICIPLVLFGVFSGNWTAVLYSIVATVVVVVGLFMLVARRVRKAVNKKLPNQTDDGAEMTVAGPQEEDARKARIDQLLVSAKLPPLAKVEPHFPDVSDLEVLAG